MLHNLWTRLARPSQRLTRSRRNAFDAGPLTLEPLEGRWLLNGATYVVSNTDDSGPGSLRDAITTLNSVTGLDTISFNIPGAGPHTIAPDSPLPNITDPIVLDGTTEAGIILDGINAGTQADGLNLFPGASGSTIQGLEITGFHLSGVALLTGQNIVQSNDIHDNNEFGVVIENNSSDASGNLIQGNVLSGNSAGGVGIYFSTAKGNVVMANLIGTDPTGTQARGNFVAGVYVNGASNNLIAGNVLAANTAGVSLQNPGTNGNVILGNLIGTDITGTKALGNFQGIAILNGPTNNLIKANLISGNLHQGVLLAGTGTNGNHISQNLIGLSALLGALGNGQRGLEIGLTPISNTVDHNSIQFNVGRGVYIHDSGTTGNLIEANVIANNTGIGVAITDGAAFNVVGSLSQTASLGNAIFSNGAGGVLIDGAGTVSDTIEVNRIFANGGFGGIALTNGGNNSQPAPTLLYAIANGLGDTSVAGKIHAAANTTYLIEVFDRPAGAPDREFLGAINVTTDANGDALFEADFAVTANSLTATATDSTGNTSEFSNAVTVSHFE